MQQVLREGRAEDAYRLKGPRVTLCRWFHWVGAVDFHDRSWHWRLMAIVAMCLELGEHAALRQLRFHGVPWASIEPSAGDAVHAGCHLKVAGFQGMSL